MSFLVEEVKLWNTPAVGAYLLWRFTQGYVQTHVNGGTPIVILHFIALPLLMNPMSSDFISRRRRNLESYVRGFHDERRTDILVGLQQKIRERRAYTMASIDLAVAVGLLAWDVERAELHSVCLSEKRGTKRMSPTVRKLGDKAEVLGEWFASQSLQSIQSYLGVVL